MMTESGEAGGTPALPALLPAAKPPSFFENWAACCPNQKKQAPQARLRCARQSSRQSFGCGDAAPSDASLLNRTTLTQHQDRAGHKRLVVALQAHGQPIVDDRQIRPAITVCPLHGHAHIVADDQFGVVLPPSAPKTAMGVFLRLLKSRRSAQTLWAPEWLIKTTSSAAS